MKRFLTVIFALLALSSCVRDLEYRESPSQLIPEGAKVTIPFTVTMEAPDLPATKTIDLSGDITMENLCIAVFGSSGYLKEYVKAQDLTRLGDFEYVDREGETRTVAQYSFKATLTLSDNPRTIHFIGNGPVTLPFGSVDAVMPSLLSENGEKAFWQMKTVSGIHAVKSTAEEYIDANGETVLPGDFIDENNNKITNGTGYIPSPETIGAFQHIPLVKNWAKITVSCEDAATSNFTPISFAVVNVPSRGAVVPHSAKTGFIQDYQSYSFSQLFEEMKYEANLPSGTAFDTSVPSEEDFHNLTNGVTDKDGAVYLYERPVPTSKIPASSVIVYGHYSNPNDMAHEGDYYYKVDLMEGSQYYPVFRNFQYKISISKILSQGHYTPAAAAAAAGSADVSADINASHLADISNGIGRLVIDPWMSHTYTGQVTDGMLQCFFMHDVENGIINMDPGAVTVEKLPMPNSAPDLIETLSVDSPLDIAGSVGWRTIHFSTSEPGSTAKSQTIRVSAAYDTWRLYRDIVITLLPIQTMKVRCTKTRVANVKGSDQCLEIVIPEGLTESMFPLQFQIEPEDLTLTPDGSKTQNNLPVSPGPSISENAEYAGKSSYHFVRTLYWDEYRSLDTELDDYDNTWRILRCYFTTNCEDSGTTIWVANDYFYTQSVSFHNALELTFRNLSIPVPIKRQEGLQIPVHFDFDSNPQSPDEYPVITMFMTGMRPVLDENIAPLPGSTDTYEFHPTSYSVDLEFVTMTDDGDLYMELSAPGYESQTLRSHTFRNVGFVDGHRLWKSSGSWSNVACGYVNSAANKTVLFGYEDDPDAPNATITISELTGLTISYPSGTVWTPEGPRSNVGVKTYHEIDFRTASKASTDPVSFVMSSPGYVEEYVRAKRFEGSILTQYEINTSTVLKPLNDYGFSEDTPSFTIVQEKDKAPTETLTFDHITELRSATPAGLLLGPSGNYTLTVTSNESNYYVYYVQITVNNSKWNNVTRLLAPASGTPSVGEFYKYPGGNDQYIWNIPQGISSASLTLTAHGDYPISIKDIVVKTYKASMR